MRVCICEGVHIHMCACMCRQACMCVCISEGVHMHMCACVCKSNIDVKSLPQLLSTIFTEEVSVSSAYYHALDTLSLAFNSLNY